MIALWKFRTNMGRVVYERPVHFFSKKDVARIAEKMSLDSISIPGSSWDDLVETLESFYGRATGTTVDFGGGTFGGGGASRDFGDLGPAEPRMILLMEALDAT